MQSRWGGYLASGHGRVKNRLPTRRAPELMRSRLPVSRRIPTALHSSTSVHSPAIHLMTLGSISPPSTALRRWRRLS